MPSETCAVAGKTASAAKINNRLDRNYVLQLREQCCGLAWLRTPQVGIVATNPVLAHGREQVHGERVLESLDHVRRMRRDSQHLTRAQDGFEAGDDEAQGSPFQHGDLLVGMAMQRNQRGL